MKTHIPNLVWSGVEVVGAEEVDENAAIHVPKHCKRLRA